MIYYYSPHSCLINLHSKKEKKTGQADKNIVMKNEIFIVKKKQNDKGYNDESLLCSHGIISIDQTPINDTIDTIFTSR